MTACTMGARILIIVASLLALPIAQTASPVEAKKRPRTVTRTFSNPTAINAPISDVEGPVAAELYPSTIAVGGLKGRVRDVDLRLRNFQHTLPRDMLILLVGPSGQTAIVMANLGGAADVAGVMLRLDDDAAAAIPDGPVLQSGAYRPTNGLSSPIVFSDPAPPVTSANAALSVFDGADPNGTWRLFVQDGWGKADGGAFAGGWEIQITTKVKGKKTKKR